MKKLITLVVAGCMVLGSLGAASAVDVKVSGQWWFHYGYYSNALLVDKSDSGKHADRTRARQRVRTQIEFIADENLSAMLNLETNMHWGDTDKGSGGPNNTYGGLDADNATFFIKRAHLDWTLPNTQVKTRMGIQGIAMPSVVFGNPVMNADVAGVSVSTQFTPELGLTFYWARPYDRTYYDDAQNDGNNDLDDMDLFGIMLPIKTDVIRATPWAMFALIGKDSGFYGTQGDDTVGINAAGNIAIIPGNYAANAYNYNRGQRRWNGNRLDTSRMDSQTYGWWAGTTLELPILDPFFVKIDGMVGGVETGVSEYDMFGWMVAADIGYKFSWGALSLQGFYSSGDKDDDDLGQLPIISADGEFATGGYGFGSHDWRRFDSMLSNTGQGMWGIGLKVADVSFVDNLKHTLIAMYYGGTNKGDSWTNKRRPGDGIQKTGDRFSGNTLMTSDRAYEVNLLSEYKVNENLALKLDFAYIWLDLGDSWKDSGDTTGSFVTGIGVRYQF
ncbi:MAG: outer membrane homotrimeric porin [Deltaproteobacteria bacterium]|nr:outer membrane homotrimeric porin [Deltaproteobacteria bacterium]